MSDMKWGRGPVIKLIIVITGMIDAGWLYAAPAVDSGVIQVETKPVNDNPDEFRAGDEGAAAAGEVPDGDLYTLQAAMATALRDNPGLAEIKARADAMAAVPSQVGTLPDPRLSFNVMNLPTDSFALSQEPMTQIQFGLYQAVPFPGKLALREEAAKYEAEAMMDNVGEVRLSLQHDVKVTWWRLFNLDRSLQIVARNQELLRQFIKIAQTKYSVGQGLQQDVLLAQLELSKLQDLKLRLRGMRHNEEARFAALLDIPPDRPVRVPMQVDPELPELADERALYTMADQFKPLLAGQQKLIQAADSRLELAKKDYYPDFNVGATYGVRSGYNPDGGSRADFASVMFSMNLPIFTGRKQSKAVDQRRSEWLEKNFKLHSLRNKVHADISAAVSDYHRAREQAGLFETGIIPQARQTVSSMLAGYQVNKVDFLNLVRSQITLYNYEMNYWQSLSEANQALARLVMAVGVETVYE